MNSLKRIIKSIIYAESRSIPIVWERRGGDSWLCRYLSQNTFKPPRNPFSRKIARLAFETNQLGPLPLWEGYLTHDPGNQRGPTRKSDEVRTREVFGDLFTDLVAHRKPDIIVEFGTAFGVSGMYFLAGLENNQKGRLFTFEPNRQWADIALKNLQMISQRFALTIGTFEENIDKKILVNEKIDMAFIDAIHTSEFVVPQLELVVQRSGPGALIVLDDISFSEDMKNCWRKISQDRRFCASVALGNHVGILELDA